MENLSRLDTRRLWDTMRAVTPEEVALGAEWYDRAREQLAYLAGRFDIPLEKVANMAATLSPGLRWYATLELLELMLLAHKSGQPMPRTGHATFGFRPRERAWEILRIDGKPRGVKVAAFAAALLGDRDAVVVDRHALDAAGVSTGTDRRRSVSKRTAMQVGAAIRSFAIILDVSPRDISAALWIRATGASS